jgi:DNA helicase-2/ATP-dependent DNA helicase PcrA
MPSPFEYRPDVTGGPDDRGEMEGLMANPSADIVPSAWRAPARRLTPAQQEPAMRPGSTLVLAGAGTGKTSTLTASVVHKIAVEKLAASRLLVVTFTNKAAREMADRTRASLGSGAAPHWLRTFHGLAARQLRAAPEVAGLRPDFDILEADDSSRGPSKTR